MRQFLSYRQDELNKPRIAAKNALAGDASDSSWIGLRRRTAPSSALRAPSPPGEKERAVGQTDECATR